MYLKWEQQQNKGNWRQSKQSYANLDADKQKLEDS